MDDLARAHAFELAWLRRIATTVEPVEGGELVLTAGAPSIRDHNAVLLAPSATDGARVCAAADRVHAAAGLIHRRLYAHRPAQAEALRPALVGAGYLASDTLVLRWPGGALAGADTSEVVVEVADRDAATDWARRVNASRPNASDGLLDEFATIAGRQHDAGVVFLVARLDGAPVGSMRVFRDGGVAQCEELDVLPVAGGRGVGTTLLRAALRVAGDAALVFLTSDPDDWPTAWYARLGFRVCGRSAGFVRTDGS